MAKPEAWRLNPAHYPVSLRCDTRFQDLDLNRHLNNVAFAALFENARVQLHQTVKLHENRIESDRTMVAAFEINYLGEGTYPEPVMIWSGIGAVRNSSWTILQAMFQGERCIATSDTVVVYRTDHQAKPLRPILRSQLENFLVSTATT
jgi:acyl-CoA thioester hydrolase